MASNSEPVVISDAELSDSDHSDEYDSESEFDEDEVIQAFAEVQAATDELERVRRRYNFLAKIDADADMRMPDAPTPPPLLSEAVEMDGVEHPPPEQIAHYMEGVLQVLGADGFYHQTRYIFTTTTTHASQLFARITP
jgi:hypothetical protein